MDVTNCGYAQKIYRAVWNKRLYMRKLKGYRLLIKLGVEKVSPKEYLTQIFNLDKKIDDKIRERDAIMSTLLKGTDSTKEPIYSNLPSSPVENTVIKLMDHNDE